MDTDLLIILTQISDFLAFTISLWLMFYLLARGYSNPLTLRMAIILLATTVRFYHNFSGLFLNTIVRDNISAFLVVVSLAAMHNLSYQFLSPKIREKQRNIAAVVILLAILSSIFLISTAPGVPLDLIVSLYLNTSPFFFINLFDVIAAAGIIYNLWLLLQTESELLSRSFYAAILFGVSTVAYGTLDWFLQIPTPRLLSTTLLLTALILLGYSIARYQSLIDTRVSIRDFPISALAILFIALGYALIALELDITFQNAAVIAALAVATHAAYDLLRELLSQLVFRQEILMRRELRQLSRRSTQSSMQASLRRALAILCYNLDAASGLIALEENETFLTAASYHSFPIGNPFEIGPLPDDELFQPPSALRDHIAWVRTIYAAGEIAGIVAIGPRSGPREYTESDLDWLEDVADQVGAMLQAQLHSRSPISSTTLQHIPQNWLSTLSIRPDPKLTKIVEDGFRQLNDYIKLGDSPLTKMLTVEGDTHIDRGKAVQYLLINRLESLRPPGEPPTEPLPREWYSYTILHDAYVEEIPDRDIMAKLYISEGTFYRTRRRALRGVSRALMEAQALT